MNNVNEVAVVWAKERLKKERKQATIDGYALMYAKMLNEVRIPGTADRPATRLHERAAARYCIAEEIMTAHAAHDHAEIKALYASIQVIQSIADENELAYQSGTWTGKKHHRNSKKASIQKLPDDWKEQLLAIMTKHRYLNATRILACVGCRPAEIGKGVVVHHKKDGIYFEILGAKANDEDRGQVWRQIVLPLDHPIASKIKKGLHRAGSKSISETITRKALKLGFKGVSAYSFRHQFCSDLKASGFSKSNIAMAMGHYVVETQQTYGNSGAGRQMTMKVTADKKPKSAAGKVKVDRVALAKKRKKP
jgi:integrase